MFCGSADAELFFQGRVPLRDSLLLLLEEGVWRVEDLNLHNLVPLRDRLHHILTFGHFTEGGVLSIQPWSGHMRDEKLTPIGYWPAGICHREDSWLVMLEVRTGLTLERVSRSAATGASRIAALNHKIWYHPVKGDSIVVPLPCQVEEICDRDGRFRREQRSFDVSFARLYDDTNVRHIFRVGRG